MKLILAIALLKLSLIVVSAQNDSVGKASNTRSADAVSLNPALELFDRVLKPVNEPSQTLSSERQSTGESDGEVSAGDDAKVAVSARSCSRQGGGILEEAVALLKSLGGVSTLLNGKRELGEDESQSRNSDLLENTVASKPSVQVESTTGARTKSNKRKLSEKKKQNAGREGREDQELREARQKLIQMIQQARAMNQVKVLSSDHDNRPQSAQDATSRETSGKKEVSS